MVLSLSTENLFVSPLSFHGKITLEISPVYRRAPMGYNDAYPKGSVTIFIFKMYPAEV